MTLRVLFGIHAVVTFAAGVALVVAPGAIPSAVGIHLEPGAYLLRYLLALVFKNVRLPPTLISLATSSDSRPEWSSQFCCWP